MRAKKAQQPPKATRYLLSLNRKLHTLSLQRISERMKIAKRRPRTRPRTSSGKTTVAHRLAAMDPRAIVFGTACVLAGVALYAARPSSYPAEVATVDDRVDRQELTASLTPEEPIRAAASTPSRAPAARTTTRVSRAAATPTQDELQTSTSVTITGCLEQDEGTFWLKDVSGEDAPKTRSWKSGFLTKRSSPVALVDGANALRLSSHVGQRVALTGTLVDREMRARSIRVAGSCD